MKTGRRQKITIEMRAAAASLRAFRYLRLNGAAAPPDVQPQTGFFPVRDGRWFYFHNIFPNLRAKNLGVLNLDASGMGPSAEDMRKATRQWHGPELEEAVFKAGGVGAFVRTHAEWDELPQAQAVRASPVMEIVRIGDAPPEPLPDGDRPLSGLRVLDLTRVIAGPICARILAEHGADVMRVTCEGLSNSGVLDIETGIGKLSANLDLRRAADAQRMQALVREADIFSQGYRPGALAKHHLSPEALARLRPGIIYVSLNAWGYAGPWRDRRGFDTVVHSANGMADANGDSGAPKLMPAAAIDYVSGTLMAFGAMVALARRATEGGSWHVRTSLATAGQWIVDRGMVEPGQFAGVPAEFSQDYIDKFSSEISGPLGTVRYLGPVVAMSETPPRLVRPPVALGASAAEWPQATG
jgi:hypothetical protein